MIRLQWNQRDACCRILFIAKMSMKPRLAAMDLSWLPNGTNFEAWILTDFIKRCGSPISNISGAFANQKRCVRPDSDIWRWVALEMRPRTSMKEVAAMKQGSRHSFAWL